MAEEPKKPEKIEIVISDFIEDPVDDAAFAVAFQINGPGDRAEFLRVSFRDEFVERFFKVSWRQDLAKEEKRLFHEKRDLFILWALLKAESWLKTGRSQQNILIDADKDFRWAKQVQDGMIQPQSKRLSDHAFRFI